MIARTLSLLLLGTTAAAQTEVAWTNSLKSLEQGHLPAACFDVPGRTLFGGELASQAVLRAVDSQGAEVWTAPSQIGSVSLSITSIVFDGSGRIAAAGLARSPSGVLEGAGVIVYDLSGNQIWSARWADLSGELWRSVRIAGFVNGGPVLAGWFDVANSLANTDIGAIAFDATGALRWQQTFPTIDGDFLHGSALDAVGNLYLVGSTFDSGFAPAGFARKITTSGTTAWLTTRAGDEYNCVAVDAGDHPYIGGSRNGGWLQLTARLDPATGQELWGHVMTSQGPSGLSAIAIAPTGDIVATGARFTYVQGAGNLAITVSLDASGGELWRASYRAPPPLSGAFGSAIDIDSAGDVVIAGWEFDAAQTRRPFAVKYPKSIAPLTGWTSTHLPAVPNLVDAFGVAVRLDPSGDVRLFGTVRTTGHQWAHASWQLAPSGRTVCLGDGSDGACPCGNQSTAFERAGCVNTRGLGAKLEWSGVPSIAADTLRLRAKWLPTTTSVLFLQGTGGAAPSFFSGDGLACIRAPIVRLGTQPVGQFGVPTGFATLPMLISSPTISFLGGVMVPGSVHTYQIRYRDAAPFCTSEGWNSTNALELTWSP